MNHRDMMIMKIVKYVMVETKTIALLEILVSFATIFAWESKVKKVEIGLKKVNLHFAYPYFWCLLSDRPVFCTLNSIKHAGCSSCLIMIRGRKC